MASGGPLGMIWLIVVPAIGAPIAWQQSTLFLHSDTPMMGFNAEASVATARMRTGVKNMLLRAINAVFRCVSIFLRMIEPFYPLRIWTLRPDG